MLIALLSTLIILCAILLISFLWGAQEMPSNAETVISGIQKTRTYQPCCQCYLEKCTRLHPVNKQRLQSAENELLPTDRNTKKGPEEKKE